MQANSPSRTFAFGDIHGCNDMLCELLQAIAPTEQDTLIFLGDMIDRGEDSKGVLDTIMHQQQLCEVICLKGNHEEMLFNSFHSDDDLAFWLRYGGVEVLQSFGLPLSRAGLEGIPSNYIDFITQTLPYYETEQYIFAHGTPFSDIAMREQTPEGLRWRKINPFSPGGFQHQSGKTIICGHTAQKNGAILQKKGLICIDTYAYGGMNLTALELAADSQQEHTAWAVGIDMRVINYMVAR